MTVPQNDPLARRLQDWAHDEARWTSVRWTPEFLRLKARMARRAAHGRRLATLERLGWGLAAALATAGLWRAWPTLGWGEASPALLLPPLACLGLLGWSLRTLIEA